MTYNGYANYQTWNVCLWIANDEGLYTFAKCYANYEGFRDGIREICYRGSLGYETPDGVSWHDSAIEMQEMRNFWEENFSTVEIEA